MRKACDNGCDVAWGMLDLRGSLPVETGSPSRKRTGINIASRL